MNVLFISDIHGSSASLRQALFYADHYACERIVILGDILYHGPRNLIPAGYEPQEVIALLNARKDQILAVRGNCEAEVDQMVLDFPCFDDYRIEAFDGISFFCTHGHLYSPTQHPDLASGSVFASGHTHLPLLEQNQELTYLNPGSITLPKGGNPPTFALLSKGELTLRDLTSGLIFKKISINK